MTQKIKPLALIILDGWGYSEDPKDNAILNASTPNMDKLWQEDCHSLISASGIDVGLPADQMGNSEVGHLNLGAGRVVYQDFTRISKAIDDKEFQTNAALVEAIRRVNQKQSALHIMGLLSPGGVHSHEQHIHAMIEMAVEQGVEKIYLHGFLDGRDTPPRSAKASIEGVEAIFEKLGRGRIVSLVGRYYAMDRDNRWDRVERAYNLLTIKQADYTTNTALEGLQQAYNRGENDEFVCPTLVGEALAIEDDDAIIFMNFRADRAREITRAFVDQDFSDFVQKKRPKLSDFVMLTSYAETIEASIAFEKLKIPNVLGEYLQNQNLKQLRIAETEKYAHVTFFFSGGVEQPYEGEDRILIPSPDVATYDLQPEMNAPLLTDKLVAAIKVDKYDLIICNFANPDMVGHTGNFPATVKAIEALDICVGKLILALDDAKGECIITADHGNAEKMTDHISGQAHTAHTSGPVPFIYHGRTAQMLHCDGTLSDIAPTLLYLMGQSIPDEMTGRVLLQFTKDKH
ncbi:MAG: phosphoglycerate mutase (2,3-diphosphoglycerate-independent) [Gammaproteobacteria bacterium]|nr:MAG: phosphoglycerate mutase (2,3-diphosphoglycerate-independent) [Gammaproteobacteria bacterium]